MKTFRIAAVFALLALGPVSAHAAMGYFNITGIVQFIDSFTDPDPEANNPFGLSVGDEIYATAVFDATGFTGVGIESFSLGVEGSGVEFSLGGFSFFETDDVDYGVDECGIPCPAIVFEDGMFLGFDFIGDLVDFGEFTAFFDGGFGWFASATTDDATYDLDGDWRGKGYLAIPEPGSLALLGIGLAGLGFARRRKSA